MPVPLGSEPYEREPSAVILRLVVGAVGGAGFGSRMVSAFGGSGLLGGVIGAVTIGYVSVAYGDRFWGALVRLWGRQWRE
jgi:uncharacterized membrane protein